jgi:hypothetical protein
MRWCRSGHDTPASALEHALYDRLGGFSPGSLTNEIEDVIAAQMDAEQTRVLLLVGTLLMHEGHAALWKTIYDTVTDTPVSNEHQTFLEHATAAARRGEV